MHKILLSKYLIAFIVFASLGISNIYSQNYNFTASSGTFTPVVGGTSLDVIETDETISGNIPIGFSFNYFRNAYTQIKITSNGVLTFDLATSS